MNLYYNLEGACDLSICVRIDSSGDTPTEIAALSLLGASIWDNFNWGEALWDKTGTTTEKKLSLGAYRGKRIQFKFSNDNTAGVKFAIIGLRLTYNLRGLR